MALTTIFTLAERRALGRCDICSWHVAKQGGHNPECPRAQRKES